MNLRDMYRSDWTRIKEREYISRPCILDGQPACESLILIREITSPLTVSSSGTPVKSSKRTIHGFRSPKRTPSGG